MTKPSWLTWKNFFKWSLRILTAIIVGIAAGWLWQFNAFVITVVIAGAVLIPLTVIAIIAITVFLARVPVMKKRWQFDPGDIDKFACLIRVKPGHAKMIMTGSRVREIINGNTNTREVVSGGDTYLILAWFQNQIFKRTGMHFYIPYFQEPHSYDLPRYRVTDNADGHKTYVLVEEGMKGYRTDEYRIDPTPWHIKLGGTEIDTVPFTIEGTAQIRILHNKVKEAGFGTEKWFVMLDRALGAEARAVVRAEVTLDEVIGRVATDIFKTQAPTTTDYTRIQDRILEKVRAYKITLTEVDEHGVETTADRKLIDFGIDVLSFDINDFVPELSDAELEKLRAPALQRQMARGRVAQATGDANYQKKMGTAAAHNPDHAEALIGANALVEASRASNVVEALIAAMLRNQMKGK